MSEIVENLKNYCINSNIHECCLYCKQSCKKQYTLWSGCMPCSEYCEHFEESRLWKEINGIINRRFTNES